MPLRVSTIQGLFIVLACGTTLRADLHPPDGLRRSSSQETVTGSVTREDSRSLETDSPADVDESGILPRVGLVPPNGNSTAGRGASLRTVPPLPSSAELFLSALAGVAVWHLARSAREIRFETVPEWYHPGGPDKVGNAVVYRLDAAFLPCPAWVHTGRPLRSLSPSSAVGSDARRQPIHTVRGSRAPPP